MEKQRYQNTSNKDWHLSPFNLTKLVYSTILSITFLSHGKVLVYLRTKLKFKGALFLV